MCGCGSWPQGALSRAHPTNLRHPSLRPPAALLTNEGWLLREELNQAPLGHAEWKY